METFLENAYENFEFGLRLLMESEKTYDAKKQKFAIEHLDCAVEQLLKAKLVAIDEVVYKKGNETVGLIEALSILEKKTSEKNCKYVTANEVNFIRRLHNERDEIRHGAYKIEFPSSKIRGIVKDVCPFFLRLFKELGKDIFKSIDMDLLAGLDAKENSDVRRFNM